MTIEYVEIENFRGVAKGKIEGFTQLNIFVGKNNSGKSTILEALAIALYPELLPEVIKRRGWHGLDTVLSIFRLRDDKREIKIAVDNQVTFIKRDIPYAEDIEYLIKSHEFSKDMITLDSKTLKDERVDRHFRCYFDSEGKYRNIYQTEAKLFSPNIVFIDSQSIHGKTPLGAYNSVFEHGYKAHERLIKVINTVYPEIKDIRLFSEEIGLEVIYEHGKVPFFAMGDGFKSAYIYLAYLMSVENGYILCEEPENYQHPSSRKLIVRGIVESVKRNQIFISTHSLELIDDILNEAKDVDIKFFVPSLDENGILTYYSFDKEEAEFRRKELEVDLRG
jgi:AAA15 family ATPase/GTPase